MKLPATTRSRSRAARGYALVLMVFFLALLVLSTVVAAPTVISSVQREKEKEMVWRGRQYTRGIRMYYLKMRRFPTSLEDITKPKNGIRFMRQAYKDPMNTVDGSWRLIYVGPNGQLIGSLNTQMLGQYGGLGSPQGVAGGTLQNSAFGGNSNSFGNSSFGNSLSSGFGNSNSSFGNSTTAATQQQNANNSNGDASTDPNGQNADGSTQSAQPQPLQMMDSNNTFGGNIIGVGSKVNKKSFLWYQKAKNYRQFEFIWDPSKDIGLGGASRGIGTQIGTPATPNTGAPGTVAPANPNTNNNLNNMNPNPGDIPPLQAPPNQ